MRWVLITFESVAMGVLSVVASLILFFTGLSIYSRYAFHQVSNGAVGWDVVSLFGQQWKIAITAILVGIFLFGGSTGFWFFSQRLHR
jgi:hypothetical protein